MTTSETTPPAHLTALPLAELAASLGSRSRALAVRRWLFETRPFPARLPDAVPGVRGAAWAELRERAALPDWRLAGRRATPDGTVKVAVSLVV
jgi:hypothetical protein